MAPQEIMASVLAALTAIAPEVNERELTPDQPLRDQVDLDSMDWLNFLISLHKKLNIDIPESDYVKLRTLNDLQNYLSAKVHG